MGANGFFGKSEDVELLVSAIRRVASGETYVSPGLAYDVMRQRVAVPEPFAVGEERTELYGASLLSPREQEVLRCCLDGMSVTQISRKFLRSIKTISGQKRSAYRKLGIHNDSELFRLQSSLEAHTR
jgi:DNA-binding NarL/FixJ family response regulator